MLMEERNELKEFLEEVHKDARVSKIQTTLQDIEKKRLRKDGTRKLWPSLLCDLD